MKILKPLLLVTLSCLFITSCFEDFDDDPITANDIKDFVWRGMNYNYLYKDSVEDLADNRFSSSDEYTSYLNSFPNPSQLFESVIYERETVDRFSWITSNYIALEQFLNGIYEVNGMEYNLYYMPGSTTDLFGVIRLVLPNSNASINNLERGQIFNTVDGIQLNDDNKVSLLSQYSFTIGIATYNDNGTTDNDDDTIDESDESVTLTKMQYSENPIYLQDVFEVEGENVGYLMYNGFTHNYNNQLNSVFGDFAASNIQHLIIDLRYNPGGSVKTASYLGSMVTGQFNGQVFSKLEYNNDLQSANTIYNFSNNIDGASINSLNLDKVYVLTTQRSASASEMLINSLSAYITVVQIGTNTTGKSQASITVYDSPDFKRNGAHPGHTYAMQPLVATTLNRDNVGVPSSGLTPSINLSENPNNYGVLGHVEEPLLAAAISEIEGTGRLSQPIVKYQIPNFDNDDLIPLIDDMYID